VFGSGGSGTHPRFDVLLRAARALERGLSHRAAPLLVGLVIAAAAARLVGWGAWWGNPDEGMQFAAAVVPRAALREEMAGHSHPPLSFLVARAIAWAGGGLDAMRVPSLAAGVALVALVFAVARRWGGPAAGVAAALLVANAAAPVALSQVVRPYMPQAACLALGVLALTRILERPGAGAAAGLALAFSGALLLHYSSFVVLAGCGLYLGALFVGGRLSRRQVAMLAAAFTPVAAIGVALWVSHVSALQESELRAGAFGSYLEKWVAVGPKRLLANVWRVARYQVGVPAGFVLPLLVAAAPFLHPAGVRFAPSWLAMTTLACAALLSLLGQYPFGPTRHSAYLVAVMAPAAGVAIAGLLRASRWWLALAGLAAFGLAAVGALLGRPEGLTERPVARAEAEAVLAELDRRSRPGDWVLLDSEAYWLLLPRFGRPLRPPLDASPLQAFEFGERRYAVSPAWSLEVGRERDDLLELLEAVAAAGGPPASGEAVWLLQGGWYPPPVAPELPERLEDGRRLRDAVVGSDAIALVRLYPEVYRDWARRREAAPRGP
jgi:hypothetical protein